MDDAYVRYGSLIFILDGMYISLYKHLYTLFSGEAFRIYAKFFVHFMFVGSSLGEEFRVLSGRAH